MSRAQEEPVDWSRASLRLAILVAFAALLLALMSRRPRADPEGACGSGPAPSCYSWPAAAIAFASRFERTGPSVIGAEHAPLAHR